MAAIFQGKIYFIVCEFRCISKYIQLKNFGFGLDKYKILYYVVAQSFVIRNMIVEPDFILVLSGGILQMGVALMLKGTSHSFSTNRKITLLF